MFNEASNPNTTSADLDKLRSSTNLLSLLSTSLIAATAGCGTGAILVGER